MSKFILMNNKEAKAWHYKKGSLYTVISNLQPLGFNCSAGFDNDGAFKAFNGNTNDFWQSPYTRNSCQILFDKEIKLVKLEAPRGQYYQVDYLNGSNEWVMVMADRTSTADIQYSWIFDKVPCKGIRVWVSCYDIQVTEWYQRK